MIVLNAETTGYSSKAVKAWQERGYTYRPSSWQEIDATNSFPGVSVLIVRLQRKIDDQVLGRFPDLTTLVSATTGHDHLSLKAIADRKIRLVSLRGHDAFLKTIPSTPELCFGLLLALVRHIPAANESVKQGVWNRDAFRGYQLKDKTLGIIGLGRTGHMMARFASGFGMKIAFFDPHVEDGHFEKFSELNALLRVCDVVSLHVHLEASTTRLINQENIAEIKPGCFLLNTSRGGVWDERAIVDALKAKRIAGVAADVLSGELIDIRTSALWQAQQEGENIIITPHLGGATFDAMWACEEYMVSVI